MSSLRFAAMDLVAALDVVSANTSATAAIWPTHKHHSCRVLMS